MEETSPVQNESRKRFWIVGFAMCLLVFAAYSSVFRAGFVWDDDILLTANPLLDGLNGLWKIWFSRENVQYYPLVFSMFFVEKLVWGLNPLGYHMVNVALHSCNAILVWLLLRRLNLKGAWLAGLIFALHPMQVESVAWISERKNLLSTLFYLLSLYNFIKFEDTSGWRWYGLSLGLFALALLSKTVTCTLPVIVLLLCWMRGRRIDTRLTLLLTPHFLMGAAMGLVTIYFEKYKAGAMGAEWNMSVVEHIILSGQILWFYILKLLWPVDVAFIYQRWPLAAEEIAQWLPVLGTLALGLAFYFGRNRVGRGPFTALACFAVTLFPALGFFNVYPMRYSFVANHFQYLACVAIIALLVGLSTWIIDRAVLLRAAGKSAVFSHAKRAAGGILVLALGTLTWKLGHAYKDSETLWIDTLDKSPSAWMAYNNLGMIYFNRNELVRAHPLFEKAIALRPEEHNAYYNLGMLYYKKGRLIKAGRHFEEAIERYPRYVKAYNHLGVIYYDLKEYGRAIQFYRKAIELNPKYAEARVNLGILYFDLKEYDKAIPVYESAIALDPGETRARNNLGVIYYHRKDYGRAMTMYLEAVEINPAYVQAHENLAALYYERKEFDKALREFEIAQEHSSDPSRYRDRIALLRELGGG